MRKSYIFNISHSFDFYESNISKVLSLSAGRFYKWGPRSVSASLALPVSLLDQTFPILFYLLNKIIYMCNDFFGLFIYVLFCCMTSMILPCWKIEQLYGESTFSLKTTTLITRGT